MKVVTFIVALLVSFKASSAHQPSVTLPEYSVLGFEHVGNDGFKADIFLGLPYAKPPMGDLRFEKPQPLQKIPDKIVNATTFSPACHQTENMAHRGVESSEDCLYLNIMAPSNKRSGELLPVLVFIHGGGFSYGFTKIYGYENYIENFVSQNIIMVTLQYRLAHFGFFATEDHEINGNFAHFDQIAALRFIKQNIKAFGGDPDKITLSGHSAGSMSVQILALSLQTRGLFKQEIHMAAAANAQWAINNKEVIKNSDMFSKAVGCGMSNTKERKACLKTVRHDEFWKARNNLNLERFPNSYDFLPWTTIYDNDLFGGKTYDELVPKLAVNNILYGFDAAEGLLFSLDTGHPITSVFSMNRGFSPENRINANPDTIKSFLKQLFTHEIFTPGIQNQLFKDIFEFYQIGEEHKANNRLHYFDKYTELLSDLYLILPTIDEIEDKVPHGFDKQYMYIFNYTRPQDRHFMGLLPAHGYELLYLSGINAYALDFDEILSNEEKLLQKQLSELFVTFVKTGKPSSAGVSVPPITQNEIPYIEFNPNVIIKKDYYESRFSFWKGLIKKHEYDFIWGKPLGKKAEKNEL